MSVENNLYRLYASHGAACSARKELIPLLVRNGLPYFSFCGMVGHIDKATYLADRDWKLVTGVAIPNKQTEEEFVTYSLGYPTDTHEESNNPAHFRAGVSMLLEAALAPFTLGIPEDTYMNVYLGAGNLFLEDSIFTHFKHRLMEVHGFTQEQVNTLDKLDIAVSGTLLNPGSGAFRLNLSHIRRVADSVLSERTEPAYSLALEGMPRIEHRIPYSWLVDLSEEVQNEATGTNDQNQPGEDT